jgi:hypothetical protein
MTAPPLTVGELIACLRMFPHDMPVGAVYDCGTAGGSVVKVEMDTSVNDARESVILVVE